MVNVASVKLCQSFALCFNRQELFYQGAQRCKLENCNDHEDHPKEKGPKPLKVQPWKGLFHGSLWAMLHQNSLVFLMELCLQLGGGNQPALQVEIKCHAPCLAEASREMIWSTIRHSFLKHGSAFHWSVGNRAGAHQNVWSAVVKALVHEALAVKGLVEAKLL
jgi:hypothetical protein